MNLSPAFSPRRILAAALLLFALLAALSAAAKRPRTDEAHLASGPVNLIRDGVMGTTVFELAGTNYLRLDRYSYWQMPLNLLFQASWYKVFGVDLFRARLLPVLWGTLLIWVLYRLVLALTEGDRAVAAGAAALLALNYELTMVASDTRPDMVCALGNFAALAVYLVWRERNLPGAILAACTLAAMALFCHPNGVLGALGLAFLYLRLDRSRFAFSHLFLAAAPYLAGFALWGIYIARDVEAFRMQFLFNAQDDGRLNMLFKPWIGVWREITEKYLGLFAGFHATAPKILRVKILSLAMIAGAVFSLAFLPAFRRLPGAGNLTALTALFFFVLAVFDGQKQYIYLVHMVPLFSAAIAIAAAAILRRKPRWALPVWLALAGFCVLQAGGTLYRIREQSFARAYQPVVDYIQRNGPPGAVIFAPGEFAWGFDFQPRLVDDLRLGYYSHRRAEWVIVDSRWRELWEIYRRRQPELFAYLETSLHETYAKVHETGGYEIFRLRPAAAIPAASITSPATESHRPVRSASNPRQNSSTSCGPASSRTGTSPVSPSATTVCSAPFRRTPQPG